MIIKIAVLEKDCDVAAVTSDRNSGVVHAGFNNKTGSLMAKLCVEGNMGFQSICKDLDVPYKKTGKTIGYSSNGYSCVSQTNSLCLKT